MEENIFIMIFTRIILNKKDIFSKNIIGTFRRRRNPPSAGWLSSSPDHERRTYIMSKLVARIPAMAKGKESLE